MNRKLLTMTCLVALLQGTTCFTGVGSITSTTGSRPSSTARNAFSIRESSSLFTSCARSKLEEQSLINSNRYSASDWLHNVFTLPRSSVLRDIRNPVITIALWSTVVSLVQRAMAHSSSQTLCKIASDMCIGAAPHSFLVSSLGLLLVFRTNSAYQRFQEGRKIWENILSVSRNISRMIHLYGPEVGKDRARRVLHLVAAFPYLLRHHVRPGCLCESADNIPEPDRLLLQESHRAIIDTRFEGDKLSPSWKATDNESPSSCWVDRRNFPWSLLERNSLNKVARAQNRPLWICDRVGREVMNVPYGPNFTSRERLSLLGSVDKLANAVGQCERIHQTAVPLNYARHSLRGLTLWLVTLPFCLVKDMGLLTGPAMAVISWLLFGVYQIGYSIEDPFQGSLRLSILCDAIRRDVLGETRERESAFEINAWQDDEDDRMMMDQDETLKDLDLVEETVKPYMPPAVNQSDLILNAPKMVKVENGSWNVVGVREG